MNNIPAKIEAEMLRLQNWRRLDRSSFNLMFVPDLEERYNQDTRAGRLQELGVTIPIGVCFYLATAIMDPVFTPDIGWRGVILRLVGILPLISLLLYASSWAVKTVELVVTLCAIFAILMLSGASALSVAPLSPYSFATVYFALTYANTTLPLRFNLAAPATIVCCLSLIGFAFIHPRVGPELAAAMSLQIVIAGLFSLFANYRIEQGKRMNYLLSQREALRMSDLAADREALATLSTTDALTGLANRGAFDRHIADLLETRSEPGRTVGLLMIDVDHFKRYNDRYGHVAGDACLRAIATILAKAVRSPHDLAARFGGEEFAVLLPDATEELSQATAQVVCDAVAASGLPHANRDDGAKSVTISVGVATTRRGSGESIEEFLERADAALYAAKGAGRNRFELAEPLYDRPGPPQRYAVA